MSGALRRSPHFQKSQKWRTSNHVRSTTCVVPASLRQHATFLKKRSGVRHSGWCMLGQNRTEVRRNRIPASAEIGYNSGRARQTWPGVDRIWLLQFECALQMWSTVQLRQSLGQDLPAFRPKSARCRPMFCPLSAELGKSWQRIGAEFGENWSAIGRVWATPHGGMIGAAIEQHGHLRRRKANGPTIAGCEFDAKPANH